jgi:hypothetical protein
LLQKPVGKELLFVFAGVPFLQPHKDVSNPPCLLI